MVANGGATLMFQEMGNLYSQLTAPDIGYYDFLCEDERYGKSYTYRVEQTP